MKVIISIVVFYCFSFTLTAQSVTGIVLDQSTGEALSGVSVFNKEIQKGTTTDAFGRFTFETVESVSEVSFSYIGYEKLTMSGSEIAENSTIYLKQSAVSLQPVVVTANREMQSRTAAPVAISSLSKSALNETKPKLLYEAINKISGVHMVNLGNEEHSMSIRQPFTTRAVYSYLEDGIPLRPTGLFNHNALIEVNMDGISRLEVVKGPASSLYGGNAIGGTINVITQTPSFFPTAEFGLQRDNFGYSRAELTTGNTFGDFGIFVGGYVARQRDGWRDHSDFDKNSVTVRGDYFISDQTKLTTTFSSNYLKSDMTGALDSSNFYGQKYSSLHTFTYREVNSQRAKLLLSHHWNGNHNTTAAFFVRNNSIGQLPSYRMSDDKNNKTKAKTEINEQSFKSLGFSGQHTAKISWLDSKLTSGIYLDNSPSAYYAKFVPVVRDAVTGQYISYTISDSMLAKYDADIVNFAVYGQYEISLLSDLKVVAGLRYDRLDYTYDNHLPVTAASGAPDETNYFDGFSPKIGATYQLSLTNGFYGNYSRGFLPPEISELYRNVKVPYLKSSSFNNYEIGGWAAFFDEKLFVDASLYVLDGENEIISVLLEDGSSNNQNSGATRHTGLEFTLSYAPFSELMVRFGGSYSDHTFISHQVIETIAGKKVNVSYDGKTMPAAPKLVTNSEITYKPSELKDLRVSLEIQQVGEYFLDVQNSRKYDGYVIYNLRTGYALMGFSVFANVQNLTNVLYSHNSSYAGGRYQFTPGAARTFTMGISYGI